MKILKIKRTANSSFVTNRDLLECLHNNKSFVASRENSTRLHSNQSKVSLLQKKNYDRILTQENDSLVANTHSNFTPAPADRAIVLLQDCITAVGDSNQKLTHKLKKVIAYVREIQEAEIRKQESAKEAQKESEKALIRKLETSCQEKAVLKMQNDELRAKLSEYRQKIASLKKESKMAMPTNLPKNGSNLEELIINQSQVIDKQCQESKREGEELRRMLQMQAVKIEEMLKREQKSKSLHSPAVLRF